MGAAWSSFLTAYYQPVPGYCERYRTTDGLDRFGASLTSYLKSNVVLSNWSYSYYSSCTAQHHIQVQKIMPHALLGFGVYVGEPTLFFIRMCKYRDRHLLTMDQSSE